MCLKSVVLGSTLPSFPIKLMPAWHGCCERVCSCIQEPWQWTMCWCPSEMMFCQMTQNVFAFGVVAVLILGGIIIIIIKKYSGKLRWRWRNKWRSSCQTMSLIKTNWKNGISENLLAGGNGAMKRPQTYSQVQMNSWATFIHSSNKPLLKSSTVLICSILNGWEQLTSKATKWSAPPHVTCELEKTSKQTEMAVV